MREIKFRAWDRVEQKMLNWDVLLWNRVGFVHSITGEGNWIGMQYTGLKDKNGIEIYEGDVVEATEERYGAIRLGERGVIVWIGVGFHARSLKPDNWDVMSPTFAPEDVQLLVIGNIYENPELLK